MCEKIRKEQKDEIRHNGVICGFRKLWYEDERRFGTNGAMRKHMAQGTTGRTRNRPNCRTNRKGIRRTSQVPDTTEYP